MATIQINRKRPGRTLLLGILSYLGTLCFVPLMVGDKDEFILFHARQGLILWGWSVLAGLSLLIPGVGMPIFAVSIPLVLAFSLIGMVSVSCRKAWKLPVIYKLSQAL